MLSGFATPEACFETLREALKANNTAVLAQCMSDEMLLISAAQSAFHLQREAFMNPHAPPEGKELLKTYQLDDLDMIGMLQEADLGGGGVPAALRGIGESISDPLAFLLAAHKILDGDKPLLQMSEAMQGTLTIHRVDGDHASGEVNLGDMPGFPLYFEKQADGWRLTLPPEVFPRRAERRALPPRAERDRLRAEREQAEQLRESRREQHSATYHSAKLMGLTTGEFDILSTGTSSYAGNQEVIGDGSVAPIHVLFEGGSQPISLRDLSEEDAAYFIQLPYAERDSTPIDEALVKPDANGRSIYSNRQGTSATFVNGKLTHFLTDSPFIVSTMGLKPSPSGETFRS